MKKIIACGLILLVLSSVFVVNTYSKEASLDLFILESKVLSSNDLAKKLVRFHVIANSDTEVDQQVKLKVKDDVLEYMIPKLEASTSKDETINIINKNSKKIQHIAEETLRTYNMDNDVSVELETTFFPTKYYKDFSLPAGDYLALRVILGSGQGKNWWCVLFPPLCLVDVQTETSTEEEQENSKLLAKDSLKSNDSIEELQDKERTESKEYSHQNSISEEKIIKNESVRKYSKTIVQDEGFSKEENQGEVQYKYNKDGKKMVQEQQCDEVSSNERSIEVSSSNHSTPKIRWKTLEMLGFYN
ncbi:stage II sporulation protein R [Alkalibaculum bacchi]|uniref:stage II sporulation protein R n=1 Tax=Alkalibaculum bacchi TaxID=645887 RepID=UPI0026ECD48E|nr:stage II sporulation protein R [Alkalibaculum bacchi]